MPHSSDKPIRAEFVKLDSGHTHRCCSPGCGDKIKGESHAWRVTWQSGIVTYLEGLTLCVLHFTDGHPDLGGGHGDVPGLDPFLQSRSTWPGSAPPVPA